MAVPPRSRVPKEPRGCHERALRLLAVRPRSRREMHDRLLRAGFETEEVEDEMTRLEEVGLLDDERFAAELAEHAVTFRRAGRRAVAQTLFAKGVARDTIERTVASLGGDEEERARELAASRVGRLHGVDPDAAYRRLVAFLVRRGYEGEVARMAAREALGLDAGRG